MYLIIYSTIGWIIPALVYWAERNIGETVREEDKKEYLLALITSIMGTAAIQIGLLAIHLVYHAISYNVVGVLFGAITGTIGLFLALQRLNRLK